jgi:hypothetical protein
MGQKEKRKHPRISISVAVSCIILDMDGAPLNNYLAIVTGVSQKGVAIEILGEIEASEVLLSFFSINNDNLEIKAKAVHLHCFKPVMMKAGLLLVGRPQEVSDFVRQLVRFYHYTKTLSSSVHA